MKLTSSCVQTTRLFSVTCMIAGGPVWTIAAADSRVSPTAVTESGVAVEKTHTLYLGADFAVQWAGQLRPVQDVQGSSFVVAVGDNTVVVPSRSTDLQIKMDDTLKISASSVTISGFKAERAYTPANNPMRRISDSIALSNLAGAATDAAVANYREKSARAGLAAASFTDEAGNPAPTALDSGELAGELSAIESNARAANADFNSLSEGAAREGMQRSEELFDAFYLTFEISAPEPLVKPYAVVVTRYRERPDQADTTRIWIYAESLPPVDTKPAKVRFFKGGFPRGYQLDDVQVHVYDQRGELATNLARKRLAITEEEAFQFAIVDYIGQHRDATARPTLMKRPSAAELRSRLSAEKLDRTFYVKVGKDGKPTGVFADAACARRLADSEVEAIAFALRFFPALEKGKAIEAAVPVHLGAGKL